MQSDLDNLWGRDIAWTPSLSCATWSEAHQAASAMQRGGVLLRTPEPPPVGAGVHLTLKFPDGSDVVLVGNVLERVVAEGAVVRFRVAGPILAQLETRAFRELAAVPRPERPLARGSMGVKMEDAEAGTTYSIHRRRK
jgi:hypothetical protein